MLKAANAVLTDKCTTIKSSCQRSFIKKNNAFTIQLRKLGEEKKFPAN